MKYLKFLPFAALLWSCGGEGDATNDNEENNTDTSATDQVDTLANEEDAIMYFEDYAQFDTRTKLYEAYDAANLDEDTAWYAEGTVMVLTTLLTDPETGNLIQFAWDEETGEKLDFIETWNRTWWMEDAKMQKVEARNGLYTGMPLTELVEWNGEDFSFSGFGWDYAGGIMAKVGMKIYDSEVNVRLDMLDEGFDGYTHLLGDMELHSASDDVVGAPVVVGTMTYWLD